MILKTPFLSTFSGKHPLTLLRFSLLFFLASVLSFSPLFAGVDSTEVKIVYFGSSVPRGEGATDLQGYPFLYSQIQQKHSPFVHWKTINISIGGDNTLKVLNRYDEDLLTQQGKYVVFALALGNEGIHEHGVEKFHQFESNLKKLITKARKDGYIPLVTNSYTRNDYNETDYEFIKKMNLLIHRWDVPSINLLGAVDDLNGHWTDGYWADGYHPNDAGHLEMAFSMVPSLFDALEQHIPQPERVKGSFLRLDKAQKALQLRFFPENILHAFTTSLQFKTDNSGTLLEMKNSLGSAAVSINEHGQLVYTSADGSTLVGNTPTLKKGWHSFSLTHYYAKGVSILYLDGQEQGRIQEKLETKEFIIDSRKAPDQAKIKDWFLYRSGMNAEEIKEIHKGPLLKSSLELYAPLDGRSNKEAQTFSNHAQSLNTLQVENKE